MEAQRQYDTQHMMYCTVMYSYSTVREPTHTLNAGYAIRYMDKTFPEFNCDRNCRRNGTEQGTNERRVDVGPGNELYSTKSRRLKV